jgi:hypothetical protein
MANPNNLIPGGHALTLEEQKMGGIASGQVRKKNAIIRNSLQKILNSGFKLPSDIQDKDIKNYVEKLKAIGVDVKNLDLVDLINLGQVIGAIGSRPECYRALLECSGELVESVEETKTPSLEITIKDNSKLEGKLYEANKH